MAVQADRLAYRPDPLAVSRRRWNLCDVSIFDVESLQPVLVSTYFGEAEP